MKRPFFSFLRENHGGALLELAVVFPIVLLLGLAAADFARVYYTGVTVANAAEAGAYYGVATDGVVADSMVMAAQLEAGSVTLDTVTAGQFCRCPSDGIVSCSVGACTGTYGVPQIYDSVRVRKDVSMFVRYAGFPSVVTVTRTAIVREK